MARGKNGTWLELGSAGLETVIAGRDLHTLVVDHKREVKKEYIDTCSVMDHGSMGRYGGSEEGTHLCSGCVSPPSTFTFFLVSIFQRG